MSDDLFLEGQFLIAMPEMGDQRFAKSVIFICAHSSEGAMGFIVNKVLETPSVVNFLEQLEIVSSEESKDIPDNIASQLLHTGGPVEPGRGFVLHTPDYTSESTLSVGGNVCLTATLEILRAIATGTGPEKVIMALGYSGWATGQLEEEIGSNGWLSCEGYSEILFDTAAERKYEMALAKLGIDISLLSSEAGHA